ncbi:MAG: nickel pincer cofactor biosynthesis protein LarB [Lentisphaerae bacterium]|nr:nickel pincer cofactor biosynthesis protein LarB [Lentisphaerota bacterium]
MRIEDILKTFRDGRISLEEAASQLEKASCEDLGFAKLDYHREIRRGFGEVVFCSGKTDSQLIDIFKAFAQSGKRVMGTRCSPEKADALSDAGVRVKYDACSRIVFSCSRETAELAGNVAVCTGGTADIPVAEEAAQTAEFYGAKVERYYDIGVAGIHRLFSKIEKIRDANAIVAVAGMEGALAGVIAGLVAVPVIAVPTSVGYGASFNGLSALLTMLNSCAEGVSVVNIDNGFGAGYIAAQINRQCTGKS